MEDEGLESRSGGLKAETLLRSGGDSLWVHNLDSTVLTLYRAVLPREGLGAIRVI